MKKRKNKQTNKKELQNTHKQFGISNKDDVLLSIYHESETVPEPWPVVVEWRRAEAG